MDDELVKAVRTGDVAALARLLEQGWDVNAHIWESGSNFASTLLIEAVEAHQVEQVEVVRFLLKVGASVDGDGDEWPGTAIQRLQPDDDLVAILVAHGSVYRPPPAVPYEWLQCVVCLEEVDFELGSWEDWEKFKSRLRTGDELWAFCSPEQDWRSRCGRYGFTIVRQGEPVRALVTFLN